MWLWIALVVVGIPALIFVGGVLHLRHSIRVAEAAIGEVVLADIPALREECLEVFRAALEENLDLDDFEGSAEILSGYLDRPESLKQAFAKDDFYWYFVLPVGAFIGELLRVHLNGAWRDSEMGLELAIPIGDDHAETYPFHKVVKHVAAGDPGDVYAYFMTSRQLEKITDEIARAE